MNSAILFTVFHADGRTEQLTVEANRALVGSASHCEIRLPFEDAAPEHLLVVSDGPKAFGETCPMQTPPLLDGTPLIRGEISRESTIAFGRTSLKVEVIVTKEQKVEKNSKVRVILLSALFVVAAYMVLVKARRPNGDGILTRIALPDLWQNARTECPQKQAAPALELASELEALAKLKRARAPFVPEAGVAAVEELLKAASCYKVANNQPASAHLKQDAEALKTKVSDEFRLSHLRLERAVITKDWESAKNQVEVLKSFVGANQGKYRAWLNNAERRITVNSAKSPAKRKGKGST